MSRSRVLLATAVALAVTSGAQARAATPIRTGGQLDAALRAALRPAGSRASVVVHDSRGRRVVDVRGATRRPLGSTAKLLTASAVLASPLALATSALAAGPVGPDGTLAGDLVLRGGGDPSLGSAPFLGPRHEDPFTDAAALADQVVARGIRVVQGAVVGDEGALDAVRGDPSTRGAFDPELEGVLGGLTWNRGRAGDAGDLLTDPARGAAAAFDDELEARGVVVRGVPHVGVAPAGAVTLASVTRAAGSLVRPMLKVSDDLYAEALAKDLGARATGTPGTTAAGAAAIVAAARELGARPRLVDGSGLSARTEASARDLVALLEHARRRPWGPQLVASLPIAGTDGTLAHRLTGIRGRCRAKTGNLGSRVAALAGTCRTRSGRTLTFAAQVEHLPLQRGEALVDRVATTLAQSRVG